MKRFTLALAITIAAVSLAGCSTAGISSTPAAPSSSGGHISWYADTYGTFKTITKSGKGDDVITLPGKAGIVTATYAGKANFVIAALDKANKPTIDLLVNTIGSYRGVTTFGTQSLGNEDAKFRVTASGKWRIVIADMDTAPAMPKGSARGDGVYKFEGSAATWTVANKGSGNFVLEQFSASPMPNLAVNEIGNYAGKVTADPGPSLVVVKSDGVWSIK